MNNVTIRIQGGLGNQLYGYALGRALTLLYSKNVSYDIETAYINDIYGRKFELYRFPNIKLNIYKFNLKNLYIFKLKIKIHYVFSLLMPTQLKLIYYEHQQNIDIDLANFKKSFYFNILLIGTWGSELYFHKISNILYKELIPYHINDIFTNENLFQINKLISCSIHFRSYNEAPEHKKEGMQIFYAKSIDYVKMKFGNISFFIFSDDIELSKKHFNSSNHNTIFVNNLDYSSHDRSFSDFFLMYNCKISIIGDSTFSWWASYLNQSNKIEIIAPEIAALHPDNWIPNNWTRF